MNSHKGNSSSSDKKSSALMPTYQPLDRIFDRGQGCEITDSLGRSYLDFAGGIAVTGLGHAHPSVMQAIRNHADGILHRSNLFSQPEQEALAQKLNELCSADDYKSFFCNSGAEANEAAIKLARYYQFSREEKQRSTIVTLEGSFHGRTLATIFASGKKKYTEGFGPPVPGFIQIDSLEAKVIESVIDRSDIAAFLIEPIQGENGVFVQEAKHLQNLSNLCQKHGILLMVDEVQCGNGRTGRMWCHQHAGIIPDVITTAKGLSNGIPVGACLARDAVASCFRPGLHGSTFGGNPLAMAVGSVVLTEISRDGFLTSVTEKGHRLHAGLRQISKRFQQDILSVRGVGLMQGVTLNDAIETRVMMRTLADKGLLTVPADKNTLRFLPPLIVSDDEIDRALRIFSDAIESHVRQRSAIPANHEQLRKTI